MPSNLRKEMLPNLGVVMLIIHFVRGISRTPRARSLNPGVELMALCSCKVNCYSICVSDVLISSNITLRIIALMLIVLGGMGPSGGGGNSGVKRLVEAVFLQELDLALVASMFVAPLLLRCSLA